MLVLYYEGLKMNVECMNVTKRDVDQVVVSPVQDIYGPASRFIMQSPDVILSAILRHCKTSFDQNIRASSVHV
jgi:hypothetical protein